MSSQKHSIAIFCSAGMSSSLFAKKLQEYFEELGFSYEVNAYTLTDIEDKAQKSDVMLLSPQIKFKYDSIISSYPDKIILSIEREEFGGLRVERIGQLILEELSTLKDSSVSDIPLPKTISSSSKQPHQEDKTFSDKLTRAVGNFASNKFLVTLRDSFLYTAGLTGLAGICIMLGNVFFNPGADSIIFGEAGLGLGILISGSTEAFLVSPIGKFLSALQAMVNVITNSTLMIASLLLASVFASRCSKTFFPKNDSEMLSSVFGLSTFIMVLPRQVALDGTIYNLLDASYFGSTGIFTAILVVGCSTWMYNRLLMVDKIVIKMPPGVPPAVEKSFASLFPGMFTLFAVAGVTVFLDQIFGTSLPELIYKSIQLPIQAISGNWTFTAIVLIMLPILMWFGIHGGAVLGPIIATTWGVADLENMSGVADHLVSNNLYNFACISSGAFVVAPILAIFLFGDRRNAQMRSIAKIGTLPGIFNISEPVVFGVPLVLNPFFIIPMVLSQTVPFAIAYFFTSIGFIPIIRQQVPWTIPTLISGFLYTNSFNGVIVQAIILVVTVLMYIPFIVMYDKHVLKNQGKYDDL